MTIENQCPRCKKLDAFAPGAKPLPHWTCLDCDPKRLAEEMAQAPTSALVAIIVREAIEDHEDGAHGAGYSQTEQRGNAARKELDMRIPARPWWTHPG